MISTGLLLAAAPTGQLWRPLLVFGVIALLMGLVVVAHLTDPRRRRDRAAGRQRPPEAPPGPAPGAPEQPGDPGRPA